MTVLKAGHTLSAGSALGADRVSRTLWLVPFWSTPDSVAVGLPSLRAMLLIMNARPPKRAMMSAMICLYKAARHVGHGL